MLTLFSVTLFFITLYALLTTSSHSAIAYPDEEIDFGGSILFSGAFKVILFVCSLLTLFSPTIYRLKWIFWVSLPIGIEYTIMLIPDIAYFIKEKRITSFFNILVFVWYVFFLIYYISTY